MNIDVNPNTALVICPLAVAMSAGRAKNARYVSEFPSSSSSLLTAASPSEVFAASEGFRGMPSANPRMHENLGCHDGRSDPSRMRSAIWRIFERSLIAVRWMNVKASCSLMLSSSMRRPFARSIALRGGELFAEGVDLAGERAELAEPADRDLDRRHQIALLERLDEVGQRAGVTGVLDDLPLTERGEHEHPAQLLLVDDPRRGEPVHARHLDVQDGEVGQQLPHQLDGCVAPPGLADDLVALLLEGLAQVHPDDGFVFGDHDPDRH